MDIKHETNNDKCLQKVISCLQQNKWSDDEKEMFKAYYCKRNKLSIQNGVFLWGL